MYVDSHCHLTFPDLIARWPQIKTDMLAADVRAALVVCTTLEEFATVQSFAAGESGLWASCGVHPDNEGVQEPSISDLQSGAALPKVVAVGETGLDYYRLNGRTVADMEWQRERFRTHIRAAQAVRKPLIIHTRSASVDTIAILKEEGEGASVHAAGGVFHCFTETLDVARAALDLGFFVSFSGIVSFTTAQDLRDVAALVPADRLLIETDSPYLAPVPHRGKTNTPAFVPHVAHAVAQVRGMGVEALAELTRRNFYTLFTGCDASAQLTATT